MDGTMEHFMEIGGIGNHDNIGRPTRAKRLQIAVTEANMMGACGHTKRGIAGIAEHQMVPDDIGDDRRIDIVLNINPIRDGGGFPRIPRNRDDIAPGGATGETDRSRRHRVTIRSSTQIEGVPCAEFANPSRNGATGTGKRTGRARSRGGHIVGRSMDSLGKDKQQKQ